jgi:tRNA A-37 threonylcarbamoyl transferase component Bud32
MAGRSQAAVELVRHVISDWFLSIGDPLGQTPSLSCQSVLFLRVDNARWCPQSKLVAAYERTVRTSRLDRLVTSAPRLLSKHLWIWPILGAMLLGSIGYWAKDRIEGGTRADIASRLEAILDANVSAVKLWFSQRETDATIFAADNQIRSAAVYLAELADNPESGAEALADSAAATTLRSTISPLLKPQNYLDFLLVSTSGEILAAPDTNCLGMVIPKPYLGVLEEVKDGQVAFSRPVTRALTPGQTSAPPVTLIGAPVSSPEAKVVAALILRIKPEEEFSRIFTLRTGESSESYAFDRRGIFLTATRYDSRLKALGVITNGPGATAIGNLAALDPGVNLEVGERPKKKRADLPLTRLVASAVMGDNGVDVLGYRNYRGVQVVGAWAWLPEYRLGLAAEVPAKEAFGTLNLLRQAFFVLFALLVVSGAAVFSFTIMLERLADSIRANTIPSRKLGPYVLLQEIGRGATGMVYRARHALLRRPVAVKMLSPELTNESTAARFEHEVQMTSQLTHPNTVAIYDYGRTPEGLFYYAMEYLSGINLDHLVRQFGPQPEGRVIHILRQVCGSLEEAHQIGLIHRDIKPANIVLTRRGGMCDVVKVLDFGLVKNRLPVSSDKAMARAVVGTPHFMSPEAIQDPAKVDARSDLYSLGAVGFWLLTGTTLFGADNAKQVMANQVSTAPSSPSERLGRQISAELESLILSCLSKVPEERPAGARELDQMLARCPQADAWTLNEADEWWKANLAGIEDMPLTTTEKTLVIGAQW